MKKNILITFLVMLSLMLSYANQLNEDYIYQVTPPNETIDIPKAEAVVEYTNATNLDRTEARLSGIEIDGEPLLLFDGGEDYTFYPDRNTYTYFLPYTYNKTPRIVAKPIQPDAIVSISETGVLSGIGTKKQVIISITSTNGANNKRYYINFEILPKLDLFLCIGQSNMAGRGNLDPSSGDLNPVENVYLLSAGSQVEVAQNPYNKHSNIRKPINWQKMSPSYSFSKEIAEKTGNQVGLVVNALGGSNIKNWLKGNKLYDETMIRALEAKKWGEYKAILWHQGESNASTSGIAAYPDQLKSMVTSLREDLGNEKLFFVAGELNYWGGDKYINFNVMIQKIATYLDYADYVSTAEMKDSSYMFKISDPHFNRKGCLELGEKYAEIVWQNVYNDTTDIVKKD